MKKRIQTIFALTCVTSALLGFAFLSGPATHSVTAETAKAEWVTGNENVTATLGYDFDNSDYKQNNWYYGAVTEYTDLTTKNAALQAEGFWTEDDYVNMDRTPLFYQTVAGAENPSITLGYYSDDFMMSSHAVHSIMADTTTGNYNRFANFDYQGLIYTFTDIETGNYFCVKVYSYTAASSSTLQRGYIQVSYNGGEYSSDVLTTYYFGGQYRQSANNASSETFSFLNIKYDKSANAIKHNWGLANSISLSNSGIPVFNNYKVDMEFWNIKSGRTAGLMVYFLNGYDLNDFDSVEELNGTDKVLYQKAETLNLSGFEADVKDVVGVWNSAVGTVVEDFSATVKDASGNDVALTDGKFAAENGTYTVTATYESQVVTFAVDITVPDISSVPSAEWATGNENVTATFGYDLKNSEYGANNWYYGAVTEYTDLTTKNAALQAEGFWTEDDYVNMDFKPLFYQTVAGADNPSINLGYYSDDFMMSSHAVHSIMADTTTGNYNRFANFDYQGLIYTFTDIETGNYFRVKVYSYVAANDAKLQRGYIQISYNGGEYSSDVLTTYYFGGQYRQSANNASSETFSFLNIKYDKSANAIKHKWDLSGSISLAGSGIPAFNNYKVDMEFWNIRSGRTAGLMVYFLNGYELCEENKYTLADNNHNAVMMENNTQATAASNGVVSLANTVKVWNNFDGFVESGIAYSVTDKGGNSVAVENDAFVATYAGEYTVTAAYGENVTKEVTLNVSYPDGGIIIKKARLNLEGKIGVQFLLSVDENLYDADGGKAVFTIADEEVEVPFSSWVASGKDYIVECKVAAKQMTDLISLKCVDKNGVETASLTYSVKEYANAILSSENSSQKLISLVKAMLNYGAYAQTYFNYNTENLANAGVFEGENPVDTLTEITAATITLDGAVTDVALKSLSLALEAETEIYVLFALNGVDMADVEFKLGDTVLKKTALGSDCCVIIPNIAAKDIDNAVSITVTHAGETATYTMSAQVYLSIAYGKLNNVAYDNLLKAIQLYNVAADEYFGA